MKFIAAVSSFVLFWGAVCIGPPLCEFVWRRYVRRGR
jgi:hypothetical protein